MNYIEKCAQNIELLHLQDGIALWCELAGGIIGVINNGRFEYRTATQLSIYQEWLKLITDHDSANQFGAESDFRNQIAETLKADGWSVAKEQYTSQGRIDILATKNGVTWIIETKLSNLSNSAAHALGQLLFYQKFYPGALLFFACPEKPDRTILSILKSHGVQYYEDRK